jgi:hypothetical protein
VQSLFEPLHRESRTSRMSMYVWKEFKDAGVTSQPYIYLYIFLFFSIVLIFYFFRLYLSSQNIFWSKVDIFCFSPRVLN